ncbi:NfeD family protein [Prevotellamassilia timonensis]|uniref:NfeD family protein n=1 Tax=Prevotellamassilia timonensis TaxID=1852370 RepID=UPI001F2BBFA0|nr:NfeD family protein [Prevotellamassilia timonensis]MCF2635407.1 hypothetical protein [Prevotellamassilia timonensis]
MTIIIILALLALCLGVVEIFIIPGFGVSGIAAILCALADVVLIYQSYGFLPAVLSVAAALVLLGLMLWWVSRSRMLDRMALHSTISSSSASSDQLSVQVGDHGVALTRLALIGNARINGKQVEVKSSGAFINPGTPLVVVAVNEANVTVEACPQT